MKHLFYTLSALLIIAISVSCGETKSNENQKEELIEQATLKFNNENLDTLKGIYIGDFGGEDIRVIITHVGKNHIVGFNLFKGLRRNISGTYINKGDTVSMTLAEPGDDKYDGIFEMDLFTADFSIKGKWKSNSGKIASKNFKLSKIVEFDYEDAPSKIDNSNFTNYFYWVEDSIGSIHFDNDGSCIYSYYPKLDDVNRVEQKEEIKGSWSIKNLKVLINWQPNPIFPSRKTEFTIRNEEYYYELEGEGRLMHSLMY
ncbi:MAG: hypothetical protein RLZ33_477 [Bacteroidota bacterium]